jgi:hypothetical protein
MKKIVFIWIGENFPEWGITAIDLAFKHNQDIHIDLIISGVLIKSGFEIDSRVSVRRVEDYYTADKSLESLNLLGDLKFRNKFWLRTTERYIVLKNFMAIEGIEQCFHAELDNVIFDLGDLDKALNKYGKGIFAPRESIERGVASFIYINDVFAMQELCKKIFNSEGLLNDMYLMGNFLDNSPRGHSLPTENEFLNPEDRGWSTVPEEITRGVFDAIAIGMYVLGVDWRNIPMQVKTNMYIYEFMGFDLKKCYFKYEKSKFLIECNGKFLNVFNLHIHSKQLSIFNDEVRINKIIKNLNNKRKTIIGKPYNLLLTPLLILYKKIRRNEDIKKLVRFFYYKLFFK